MAGPRRPSALRHGLTSSTIRLEYSNDVVELAEALLGASSRDPQLLEAAREAAVAILYLRRVQHCRLHLLEEGTLQRCTPTEAGRKLALELSVAVKHGAPEKCRALRDALTAEHDREWILDVETAATFILGDETAEHGIELHRLAEYERRAHSARRKSLRRLDYQRVEAERRRVGDGGSSLLNARRVNTCRSKT